MLNVSSGAKGDAGGLEATNLITNHKVKGGLTEFLPVLGRRFAGGGEDGFVVVEAKAVDHQGDAHDAIADNKVFLGNWVKGAGKGSRVKKSGRNGGKFAPQHRHPGVVKAKDVGAGARCQGRLKAFAVIAVTLLLVVNGDVGVKARVGINDGFDDGGFFPKTPIG